MSKTKTRVADLPNFDAAEYLKSEQDMQDYLSAALDDGDPSLVAAALGDIARARNMAQLARDTGMSREGLYRALSGTGNPTLATVMKVAAALGFKLSVTRAG